MGIDVLAAKAVAEREEEGTPVHIKDEASEPQYEGEKPVTITVVGSFSTTFRKAEAREMERQLKHRQNKLSADLVQKRRVALAAAACTGWQGFTLGDQPFPFSRDNAVMLFEAAPWILAQVEEARDDHEGFSGSASKA